MGGGLLYTPSKIAALLPRPGRAASIPGLGLSVEHLRAIFIGVLFIAGITLSDRRNGVTALGLLLATYMVFRAARRLFQRRH